MTKPTTLLARHRVGKTLPSGPSIQGYASAWNVLGVEIVVIAPTPAFSEGLGDFLASQEGVGGVDSMKTEKVTLLKGWKT